MQPRNLTELQSKLILSLGFVAILTPACKTDPKTTGGPPVAGATGSGSATTPPRAEPPVRLEVSVDGHSPIRFTIPPTAPAMFGKDAWPKQLGFFATAKSADEIELDVALLAKDPAHNTMDLGVFQAQVLVRREVKLGQSVVLNPGTDLSSDGFGDSIPHEIKITWIR